jgi:hypothetical protein
MTRFLLPNLPETFIEDIAHHRLLPRLEKESDAPEYLIEAGHNLMAALFESHTKFPHLVLRLLHPYFGILLDVTLHHQPDLFRKAYDAVLEFLCQTEYDAVNEPLEREKYGQVIQSIIGQSMDRFASLVDGFVGKDGMDKTKAEARVLLESLLGQIEGLPDFLSEQVQAFAAEGLESGPLERQALFRESVSLVIGDPYRINYERRAGLIQRFSPLLSARL